ncbi:hypothetical protein [Falsiroseomonas frigidaquae]|uniref:hypothetical protein n=1 Tax=Falsiroseomonas frigidaquae TaxID=487318 RepID=UPI0015C5594C|nr:hypothetical protein [Falsiroseomonas frigidaquae]
MAREQMPPAGWSAQRGAGVAGSACAARFDLGSDPARHPEIRASAPVPDCPRRYTALAVLRQLTEGGNAFHAETFLMHAPADPFRPVLAQLRAGDEAGVVERMKEILST